MHLWFAISSQLCGFSESDFGFHQFHCLGDHQDSLHTAHKDRNTKQQGPLGLLVQAEGCRYGLGSSQSI